MAQMWANCDKYKCVRVWGERGTCIWILMWQPNKEDERLETVRQLVLCCHTHFRNFRNTELKPNVNVCLAKFVYCILIGQRAGDPSITVTWAQAKLAQLKIAQCLNWPLKGRTRWSFFGILISILWRLPQLWCLNNAGKAERSSSSSTHLEPNTRATRMWPATRINKVVRAVHTQLGGSTNKNNKE